MLSDEISRFLSENKQWKYDFISTVCKKRAFYEFSTKSLAQKV